MKTKKQDALQMGFILFRLLGRVADCSSFTHAGRTFYAASTGLSLEVLPSVQSTAADSAPT